MPVIGFSFLLLAITASFFQIAFYFSSKVKAFNFNQSITLKSQKYLTLANAVLLCLSMLCLIYCFVVSDFSVNIVYLNSHELKPLIYKIAGTWGNHEGSILMLVCILSLYSCAFALFSKADDKMKILVLLSQALINFGILAFIIFTSNPFARIFPIPESGLGLNPILQDIGLAMHPPMLYTGYIGFSLIFSLSVAGLILEKIDQNFADLMKPWIIFSWSFLTLGIGLGSWWAYRELGWGGYWFWDAVENVSLMPWFCATALLHSVIILKRSGNFAVWTSFLSILSFVFCLLGIFLVRSGVLTSVHSFAADPGRGVFIILLFLIIGGIGFIIFFFKSIKINTNPQNFGILSRTGLVLWNNFIFCLALFIVVLGTLYPLILQVFSDSSISVGPPYYNKLMAPLAMIILTLMIFVPALPFRYFKSFSKSQLKYLIISVILSLVVVIFLLKAKLMMVAFLVVFLALIALLFNVFVALEFDYKVLKFSYIIKLFKKLALSPMFLAHIGFIIIILAIALNAISHQDKQLNMSFNQEVKIDSYNVKFLGVDYGYGKNYLIREGNFEISSDSGSKFNLKPQTRYYPVSDQTTSEASIEHKIFSDLYLVLGEKNAEDNFTVRIYYRPFISFIWIGCFMMFLAGMVRLIAIYRLSRSKI